MAAGLGKPVRGLLAASLWSGRRRRRSPLPAQGLIDERTLIHVVRREFGDGCGGPKEGRGDAGGGDVHE